MMKYLIRQWMGRLLGSRSVSQGKPRSATLRLETLEDRTTPSVGVRMLDLAPGPYPSNPSDFVEMNGVVYFAATDVNGDRELWRTNGTPSGTYRVANINSTGSSNPRYLTVVDGTLYFVATRGFNYELWKSDGTAAGTILVGSFGSATPPRYLTAVGGTLYFSWYELWKSDGTTAGTVMVKDIYPGTSDSDPQYLTAVGGTLYFTADHPTFGRELWKSDGTDAGTVLVRDIRPGGADSDPQDLVAMGGLLYFSANDGVNGRELWKSDGTLLGTTIVRHINPGSASANPANLRVVDNTLYFSANDGTRGAELWKSDGTRDGTALVKDIHPSGNSNPQNLTAVGNTLYFTAVHPTFGRELWKSDGTGVGTVLVRDINPGNASSNPTYLMGLNGTLYFRASNPTFGDEVWRSDGTTVGTSLLADINPGSVGSNPRFLISYNGMLLFNATDGIYGEELWRTGVVTTLSVTGGNNQSTPINRPFATPLQVRVLDQFGQPLYGVPVTFRALPNNNASAIFGGNSAGTRATTNWDGYAEVTVTANPVVGTHTVMASIGSSTVNFTLTNDPAPSPQIVFSLEPPIRVAAGQRFRVQVKLIDPDGDMLRVSDIPIRLTLRAGSGLSGTLVRYTSTYGLATFGDLVLRYPGQYRLVARLSNGMQVISRAIIVS